MRKLNRNELKYLAIIAMLIDHVAWGFVPLPSAAGQLMHFAGRLTGPTMAFFLAEGYIHTSSRRRYALRLAVFALISWPCFSWFETGYPFKLEFGVIYTLLLGFLAIALWDRTTLDPGFKIFGTLALCMLSLLGDWAPLDVIWPLALWRFRDEPERKWRAFFGLAVVAVFLYGSGYRPFWLGAWTLGIPAAALVLKNCYNGEPGSRHPFHKWVFYVFYPAHLLVLGFLRWGI